MGRWVDEPYLPETTNIAHDIPRDPLICRKLARSPGIVRSFRLSLTEMWRRLPYQTPKNNESITEPTFWVS